MKDIIPLIPALAALATAAPAQSHFSPVRADVSHVADEEQSITLRVSGLV